MIKKKLKGVYSLDGLILKKKSLEAIQAINILRAFSSLRFFKIDYYPFGYDKFIKFFNELVRFSMFKNYLIFLKGIYFYFIYVNKNKFLKRKLGFEIKLFLMWYKKIYLKIYRNLYLKRYKSFLKLKFKFKKLKKVRYLVRHKLENRVKKTKSQLEEESIKMHFFSDLLKRKKNLQVVHHYLKNRFSKTLKKKVLYFRKKKFNTDNALRERFADNILNKKIRKRKKKKVLYKKLRLKFKGNFEQKTESANNLFKLLYNDKSKKRIIFMLKKRNRKFRRKYFLIRKYKRLAFRRKKRTGILHFRKYYSNYYITLTDLSHNVIFSCSAGSVSDTNNKKTKMSNVVSMPIFFRIKFFLQAFKIRNLKFVFRNKMDKVFFNAIHFFTKRGYNIKSYSFVKRMPHHLGQRKQKPRRI